VFYEANLIECAQKGKAWVISEIYHGFANQFDGSGVQLKARAPSVVLKITSKDAPKNCSEIYVTAFPPVGMKGLNFYVLGGKASVI
jgi:hypothetical protein